jgi:hypothetical protein
VEASFSKTTGNKTLEFGKFHPPMTWLDIKWNPSISIWYKRNA